MSTSESPTPGQTCAASHRAGWGSGLAFHAWAAFGPPSRPIDEDAVARETERLQRR